MDNKLESKISNIKTDATNKVKKRITRKVKIIIIIAILILALIGAIIGITINTYNNYVKSVIVVTDALDIWDWDVELGEIKTDVVTDKTPKYGVYPSDPTARIKQEMMEICNGAGKVYGISGKLVLAIAMVETSVYSIPALERSNGSLYTDLCIGYYKYKDGSSMFIDGPNTGKYTDANGNDIVDPIKVGQLRSDVNIAIGPYQHMSQYVAGRMTHEYTDNDGIVSEGPETPFMSHFDAELGFMRPNPLYFPDAALTTARMIADYMNRHKERLEDISNLNLSQEIKDEILFIYAADQYHGDTAASGKGEKARAVHDAMAKLYADIYMKYSEKGILTNSLGNFSTKSYKQAAVRTILGGAQFTTNGNADFDGTFNHSNSSLTIEGSTKYVELNGNRFYEPLIAELSNTAPFYMNYKQIITDMPVGPTGSNNKFGWVYGFQGLNAVDYYWNTWIDEITKAANQSNFGEILDTEITGRVSRDAYPLGDISIITGDTDCSNASVKPYFDILLGRLAKLAEDKGKESIHINSGYRTREQQIQEAYNMLNKYKSQGYYMDANGAVHAANGNIMAAAPGKSRHQTGLAADIKDSWFKQMTNSELKKWGLWKPMSYENWHVELIETKKN